MKSFNSVIVIIAFFVTYCSSPTGPDNIENSVMVTNESGQILIMNLSDNDIYFNAIEANMSALVNWAPFYSKENQIKSNSSRIIDFTEIKYYPGSKLKSGDIIIIYYWEKSDNSTTEIHAKTVIL